MAIPFAVRVFSGGDEIVLMSADSVEDREP